MGDGSAPSLTLGTAGHIDHGKTALVRALTGVDTDRLPEERRRGISIELGFARLQLPSGRSLSVVDVPGHERFVRTMVAGATGIDLFLLVVAADDGVMPQTREHVAVMELLEVPAGVVALTKTDLAGDAQAAAARAGVTELLADGPYAGAPVIGVSAARGTGLDELRLRPGALGGVDHEQEEVDAGRTGDHVADEALVAGDVDDGEPTSAGQVERRVAEVDRDPARLLLGQTVGVLAGQGSDEPGLAVIDVTRRPESQTRRRSVTHARASPRYARRGEEAGSTC